MAGSSLIGNLAVNLTMETAAFQRGATIAEKRTEAMRSRFAAATKSVSGLGAALGVGIGVAAISNLARSAFDMASALSESAEKVGVSVEALQELRFAAQQTGVSEDQLAAALNRLNKSMGELQLGKKGAVDAFAEIGLAADDLKGKAPEEALRIIADALNKLPDVQQRVAVGSQIMGKGFSQLLPLINGGSAALNSYSEEARKNGIITAEEARQLDAMADSWERIKVKLSVATAKIIAGFASLEEAVIKWYDFRDRVLAAAGELANKAVTYVNNMVSGISKAITGALNAVWDSAAKKIDWIGGKFKWLYDVVVGNSYIPDMVDEIGAQMARLDAVLVQPVVGATSKAAEAFRDLQAQTKGLLDRLFPEQAAFNTLKSEMATLEEAMKRGILTAEQYAAALNRLQTEGLSDAPIDVLGTGSLVGDDIATGFESLIDRMPQLIDRTQQWRDVVGQVSADLVSIGGDWLSRFIDGAAKLKDLFKQLAIYAIQALTSQGGPLSQLFGGARAMGGPVVKGKGYLVGENGPEWFSPGTSGRIISNDNLRGMVGNSSRGDIHIHGVRDFDSFRRNETQLRRSSRRALGIS